ncbi:ABC transporter ATP-binding protein [Paenibacillus nasutitermitis]|uniref:Multidrug resistance ABC transporter ATP-binding/permease protein YheI n=1 Tax=Paenibacillus nasutitermitis TaxID=1652958 RepID=A0A917DXQ0_9BACL|nr:ABC transporter transmembrane domain-containing protein [Paenibacillus nasutitermitis]GGD77558.1 putative multidrug resistance ABC transporter ATP-binding/permease protein YheI [Paenibacillus nasutitermitis]
MLAVLQKLGWFFKLERKRYIIAISILIICGILEVLPPMMVGRSIDNIQLGSMTKSSMVVVLLQLGGLTVLTYLLSYIWQYKLFGAAFVVEKMKRSRLMRHFLRMTPSFYERNRTGDLMARATNDLQALSVTVGFGLLTFIDSTLWMATLLVTMSILVSWKLTLVSVLPLPIMAILVSLYGKWIHSRFSDAQNAFGDMNDGVLETISGIRVTRAYVQERAAERRFADVTGDVLAKNIAVVRIDALFEPTVKIFVGASYLIGLGYGAYLVYNNELTVGGLVSFNVYLGMLIWPMFAIGEMINIMQRGNASLDRVIETLGAKPDVPEPIDPVSMAQSGRIEFQNVTFRYPSSSVDNLKEIAFSLEQGQTLGIVGRTGSGKTTLIKQLLREYPPGQGRITIAGNPLDRIDMDALKSWYGYVPQEQFLFSRTVRSNIMFGRDKATDNELENAIAASAFKKDITFLPGGLSTLVGERGVALSGGQKQRVSIARALIADPDILMLDDAMSAVDARTEAEIIANIRGERAGKTTLIATHRLSAIVHADWILVLDEGEIVEQGTHETLMRRQGWYKEQYERQQIEQAIE